MNGIDLKCPGCQGELELDEIIVDKVRIQIHFECEKCGLVKFGEHRHD